MNKLCIVVGNCDLVVEKTPEDSPILNQLRTIQSTAKSMAQDLAEFKCELARVGIKDSQKASGTASGK